MPRGYRLFCVGVGVGRQLFNFLSPGPPQMEHGSSVKPRPESDVRFPVPEQAVQPIQVFPLFFHV